ncbi:TetR/AcrR family transcriptional regulator [Pyxidicoccus fallax]|uniref:TetR/AcrR family transcriptional regulator n=1 Tax=Pyxidicoccus fallax TaxID=394095 RepID=A0A848LYW4_9BACT|nr:TetR/AcrR family transcriptional regulator [Pyxidicoccus fallax]NMO23036.1 TetR/AcrR family transcriptional regulator [Pyxidicoccus fallax]NPC85596.1 TetR/AcrR family transcriptional regulator [Pyxidicoccus fallax]
MKKQGEAKEGAKRGRGRPRGATEQGLETRQHLYETSLRLIAARGFDETTLRDIAQEAGVSVGLLYRYFPSKRAIVLALYEELSARYAEAAVKMGVGPWRERFLFALRTSLEVLGPHREPLTALVPVLVGGKEEGLFSPGTAFSRLRVQGAFVDAALGATDAPGGTTGPALGRVLYMVHLAVVLWWLLDKSPRQRATDGLIRLLERLLLPASLALKVPGAGAFVRTADALFRQGLLGEPAAPGDAGEEPAS